MALVYIGLGSNVGNRLEYLRSAVTNILDRTGASLIAESSVKETRAVDFTDQADFLNQIIKIRTDLNPLKLLNILKEIETDMGRIFRFSKGPREIDLDILLYDDFIIDETKLKVPHPEISKRDFVLEHLIEIDPELSDPVTKKKYTEVFNHAGI